MIDTYQDHHWNLCLKVGGAECDFEGSAIDGTMSNWLPKFGTLAILLFLFQKMAYLQKSHYRLDLFRSMLKKLTGPLK